jgi:hypothetical protein
MAYDERLADRIRQAFGARNDITERKMFGGLAFLCLGRMCYGIVGSDLMDSRGPRQQPGDDSEVTVTFEASDEGTRVTLVHVGLPPDATAADRHEVGWRSILTKCRALLEEPTA